MGNTETLNSVSRQEKEAMLTNHIVSYMVSNQMTIENLDDACERVKELYRKNALMKG